MTISSITHILKTFTHRVPTVVRTIGIGLIACGLWGCNDAVNPLPDEPGADAGTENGTYISMLLNTSSRRTAGSRADSANAWGDSYDEEPGSALENKIDPQKIHIALYEVDGTPLGTVSSSAGDVKIYQFVNNPCLYQVVFNASAIGIHRGREYMAAVIVNTPSSFNAGNIDNVTFNLQTLTGISNPTPGPNYYSRGALPMFGFIRWTMGTFDFGTGQLNGFPSIGTIAMLRSVAKIEVAITDDFDRYPQARYMTFDTDQKPRLGYAGRHINRIGNAAVASRFWKPKNSTTDLTFAESFHENTSQRWGNDADHVYFQATNADGTLYYIYLPEASGAGMRPNDKPLRLNVTVNYHKPSSDNSDLPDTDMNVTGTLFPSIPYDEATGMPEANADYKAWKLTRNHIYRFTITGLASETDLKYTVTEIGNKTNYVPDFE